MFYKKLMEYGLLWVIGGSLYYLFELLFRGYSHWTMFVLGGICMMFFAYQGRAHAFSEPFVKQVLRCTCFVTSSEFITGVIVNKWLNWSVWDYSHLPFNLLGQICLPFAMIFSVLCAGGIVLCGHLLHLIFKEEKPSFHIR